MPVILDISPCPRCGSNKRGIIYYGVCENKQRVMSKNLKKGYYTIFREKQKASELEFLPNRFCADCRYEWKEKETLYRYATEEEFNSLVEKNDLVLSKKLDKPGIVRRLIKKIKHRKGEMTYVSRKRK